MATTSPSPTTSEPKRFSIRLPRPLWIFVGTGTPIDDIGLANLPTLPALKELRLSGTQVTNSGLAHLRRLDSLQTLSLANTQVTDAGVAELMQALPGLEIDK